MTGIIKRITTNYSFRIPFFSAPNWGRELERNFDTIDSVLFAATGFTNVKGIWTYDTDYLAGDRVVDDDDASLWQCLVSHTSPSSGTMSEYRAANPTHWQRLSQSFVNRGQWTTATVYNVNEFVYDANRYGVVINKYTSDASYDTDVSNGNIVTLADFEPSLTDAAQSATDAQTAQAAAELAETHAETAETNAEAARDTAGIYRDEAQTAQGLAETAQLASENAQLASENARDESETWKDLSKDWANKAEDSVVQSGEYSAKHYMEKAKDERELAAKWASNPEDVVVSGGEYSALHYAAKAHFVVGNGTQAIRYDVAQGITSGQQQQARENAGATGNLLRVSFITSSDPTWTPLPETKAMEVWGCGAGGGAGGVDGQSSSGARAVSCPGAGGASFHFYVSGSDMASSYNIQIGAPGTGGAGLSGASGGLGGTTSITDGTRTASASGGRGGDGMVATTGSSSAAPSGAQTNATLTGFTGFTKGSDHPEPVYVYQGLLVNIVRAGSSIFGTGADYVNGSDGSTGLGQGAGGGAVGTASAETANRKGGDGAGGAMLIKEYG